MTTTPLTANRPDRIVNDMTNEYSIRARRARVAQGLPEVISDPVFLDKLAGWLSDPKPAATASQAQGKTSAA